MYTGYRVSKANVNISTESVGKVGQMYVDIDMKQIDFKRSNKDKI